MKDSLLIKVVVVLLVCCLIGLGGYGVYYMIFGEEIVEEIDVKEDEEEIEVDEDPLDEDINIDGLMANFPNAFYAFDSEVEGYVEGNIKNVNNLSDEDLIKLVIYNDAKNTESVIIPDTFGDRTFGSEEKKAGDLIETRIFTHEEIKKEVSEIFGKERADKLVFPEFIGYGDLSTKFTNIYYSIDDKYYEGYASVGNQVDFSKSYVSYSFFSENKKSREGTLIITYLVKKNYINEVVDEYHVSETYKRDASGNYTWISIEKE